jgi:phosphate acetyltransferase
VTKAVYVMSLEPESGKSLISLGLAESLSQRVSRFGYFRPVVASGDTPDDVVNLIRERYKLDQSYEASFGVTTNETRSAGSEEAWEALVATIMTKFHDLAAVCDVVLVEGTDYTGASAAFEFELNASVATNLAAPIVLVTRGHSHRADQVTGALHAGLDALRANGAAVASVIVNRVDPDQSEALSAALADMPMPHWLIPEEPRLAYPNLRQAAELLGAEIISGDDVSLGNDVASVKVAAMTPGPLLEHLSESVLLITSGDRSDVLFTAQLSHFSESTPRVSGVLLTGGLRPDQQVIDTLAGVPGPALPLLLTDLDTYDTASAISSLRPHTAASDLRRIDLSLGLFDNNVDSDALFANIDVTESTVVTPLMFEHRLLARARSDKKRIVLPEGSDDRILQAAERILQRDVCSLVILDANDDVVDRANRLGVDLGDTEIINPASSPLRQQFADELVRLRAHKGMTPQAAYDSVTSVSTFGTMLVHLGIVGGMVSGAAHTTADTIRPALQIIRTTPGVSVVSSVFFMSLRDRVLVYGDCAVNPDPDPGQLADIAISSARTAAAFGIDPYVAMLSYSTGASGSGGDVEKVREATTIARERATDLPIEGPIQYDAAVDASVAASKLPGSDVAGRATVFVLPDLNTGNNTYKAVQRSAGAVAIGPVLQGLRKPVNDLSRGCTVADIFNTVAITAVQAQQVAAADGG